MIRIVFCIAALLASPAVFPQAYPAKAVRTIVPFSPGGVTDNSARVIADPPADPGSDHRNPLIRNSKAE